MFIGCTNCRMPTLKVSYVLMSMEQNVILTNPQRSGKGLVLPTK